VRLALLPIVLLAAAAPGQTLTRAPALAEPPAPLQLGAGGTVVLDLELDAQGHLTSSSVAVSGGPALDALALAAAPTFRFTPAEVDGQPAAVRVRFEVVVAAEPPDAGPPVPVVTVEGTLRAAGTREVVAGALVSAATQTVSSDEAGRFALLDVPPGPVRLVVVAAGFERLEANEVVSQGNQTVVTYYLQPSASRGETVVRAERERREVAQVRLERTELSRVAGTSGDAFKVLQSLPSVARPSLGSSALVVRGSKSWDSRIYVDEVQVPQLFHFAGLSATFNAANVERLSFLPGNFGAGFGRAIGGLVLADTRSPSHTGLHGYVDLGVLEVSALVEGPVAAGWAFTVSARRGLTDLLVPWALKTAGVDLIGFALAPQSWDYQVKLERGRAGRDRVFLAAYGSSDRYQFLAPNFFLDTEVNQGSAGSAVQYHRLVLGFERRLAEGLTLISRTSVGLDLLEQLGGATNVFYRNLQVPVQLRDRLEWDLPDAHLAFSGGVDAVLTPTVLDAQLPPAFNPARIPEPYVARRLLAEQSTTVHLEPGVFLEGRWQPLPALTVVAGVRGDWQSVMRQGWVDPRLVLLVTAADWVTFKAGAGIYHQSPDYRSGQLSPIFGNPDLKPEGARHLTAGAEVRVEEGVNLDVQGWYKDLFDQARQVLSGGLGSDINIPGAASRYASTGTGHAYGVDVLLKARLGPRFFGWVAYTFSRVEREAFTGTGFIQAVLDQPHNLVLVASAELPWGLTFGGRFRFASGPLVTPVGASLYDNNGNYFYPLPGLPWSDRLASFVQLDLRVDKRFVFEQWSLEVYLDVQNATNQQNPEARFYNFDYSKSALVYGIPVLPSVGARGVW
jgi:TonB family protein